MTLCVYTARIGCRDPDILDVTRMSGTPFGTTFAPSWSLLKPYLDKRRSGGITDEDWKDYVTRYTEEMRDSYREKRSNWNKLLARKRLVLLCYCTDSARCHRTVLANILKRLGAAYEGEL